MLPTLNLPKHPFTVPSTGQKTTIRPFTVREEKILLVAKESKDMDSIMRATKDVMSGCIQDVDINEMAMFDLEYALLKIRAISVSNLVELKVIDPDVEETVDLELDINKIEISLNKSHSKIVQLDDTNSIVMRYPTIDEFHIMTERHDDPIVAFDIMMACIDQIVSGDQVFESKDFLDKELLEFVDGFTSEHIKSVKHFFETMPTLAFEIPYTLSDGTEKTFKVKGSEILFT